MRKEREKEKDAHSETEPTAKQKPAARNKTQKTSSRAAARYLLAGRREPQKVGTFPESGCWPVFLPGFRRAYGETPDIPDLSQPITADIPLPLPKEEKKKSGAAERKSQASVLNTQLCVSVLSLLPGFSSVCVATTLLSPPCLRVPSSPSSFSSLLLLP